MEKVNLRVKMKVDRNTASSRNKTASWSVASTFYFSNIFDLASVVSISCSSCPSVCMTDLVVIKRQHIDLSYCRSVTVKLGVVIKLSRRIARPHHICALRAAGVSLFSWDEVQTKDPSRDWILRIVLQTQRMI